MFELSHKKAFLVAVSSAIHPSTLDIQLKGFANLVENFDPYAAIMVSISWNQKKNRFSIFNSLEHTKNDSSPEALKPFSEAKPQYLNTMPLSTLSDFSVEAGKFAVLSLRLLYRFLVFCLWLGISNQ